MVIRRIGVLSLARILGAVDFAIGLVVGLFMSIAAFFGTFAAALQGEGSAIFGMLFGVGAVFILPLFYGFLGFVAGALVAFVYNLAADFLGGLELDIDTRPAT